MLTTSDNDETKTPSVSIRAQIEALDIGETFARATRFDADTTFKTAPPEVMHQQRSSLQATVHRIEQRTGNKYMIEVVQAFTYSRDIMIFVCVTRTE